PDSQAFLLQFVKYPQQGKIGFRRGFVQPFHAMGPSPMVDHIGKMRMQRKGDVTHRVFHWSVRMQCGTRVPKSEYRASAFLLIDALKRVRIPSLLQELRRNGL